MMTATGPIEPLLEDPSGLRNPRSRCAEHLSDELHLDVRLMMMLMLMSSLYNIAMAYFLISDVGWWIGNPHRKSLPLLHCTLEYYLGRYHPHDNYSTLMMAVMQMWEDLHQTAHVTRRCSQRYYTATASSG